MNATRAYRVPAVHSERVLRWLAFISATTTHCLHHGEQKIPQSHYIYGILHCSVSRLQTHLLASGDGCVLVRTGMTLAKGGTALPR
jgi:hypothetical protein